VLLADALVEHQQTGWLEMLSKSALVSNFKQRYVVLTEAGLVFKARR
jgi:hypothetical protein